MRWLSIIKIPILPRNLQTEFSLSRNLSKKKKIMKTDNSKMYTEMLEEKKIAKTNLKKRTNLEKLYYHILKFIIKQ